MLVTLLNRAGAYKVTHLHWRPSTYVKDTGAQYSTSSDGSDIENSDSDENIAGTENITVTKRYLNRHSLSSEDLYTAPVQPTKRFRTFTPDPYERKPEK